MINKTEYLVQTSFGIWVLFLPGILDVWMARYWLQTDLGGCVLSFVLCPENMLGCCFRWFGDLLDLRCTFQVQWLCGQGVWVPYFVDWYPKCDQCFPLLRHMFIFANMWSPINLNGWRLMPPTLYWLSPSNIVLNGRLHGTILFRPLPPWQLLDGWWWVLNTNMKTHDLGIMIFCDFGVLEGALCGHFELQI